MKRNLSVVREYSVRGYFLSFEVTGKIGKLADVYFTPSNYTRLRISNIFYTATTISMNVFTLKELYTSISTLTQKLVLTSPVFLPEKYVWIEPLDTI